MKQTVIILIISVLLTRHLPAAAQGPYVSAPAITSDTSLSESQSLEFLDDILLGTDDVSDQDGGSGRKGSTSKTTKSSTNSTITKKKTTSQAAVDKKLAVLTEKDDGELPDMPRKRRKGIGIELVAPLQFKYAILLDVPVELINDSKLLDLLESWYGTRYRYGGDSRDGVDCSGFTQAFMLAYYNINLPRNSEEQYKGSKHIKKKKLRQGDLVFFRTRGRKGGISHVGLYLCNNKFIHAATSSGVMISDLDDSYYKARYAGAGRVR